MRLARTLITGTAVLFMVFVPTLASAASTADLSVAITDHPDPVFMYGNTTYFITVTDHGPGKATGVKLVDTYGSDAAIESAETSQGTCTHPAGGEVDCFLGIILKGGTVTATMVLKNFGGDGGADYVQVSSASHDPVMANNSAVEHTTILPGPPPPSGGVQTGGGGTAGSPSDPGLISMALLGVAALVGLALRFARW